MTKKFLTLSFASLLTIGLAACAMQTSFHPYNGTDGYSSIQYNNTLYEVRFQGNFNTSSQNVRNMLLYRAAQIAQNNRYHYFQVISENIGHQTMTFTTPGSAQTQSYAHFHHHHITYDKYTSYSPATTSTAYAYNAHMKIRLLTYNKRGNSVYNTVTVLRSLQGQIIFPKQNSNGQLKPLS